MTKIAQIKSIAGIRPGYQSRVSLEPVKDGDYGLIQLRDFDPARTCLRAGDMLRFNPGEFRTVTPIAPTDVLFLAKGARNFAFHPGPLPVQALAASYFFVLSPSAEILPKYLTWFLNHPATLRQFVRVGGVSHMPVIRKPDLEAVEIPIPTLHTQSAIVDLHSLVVEEAALLDRLKTRRTALIDLVTLELAHNNAPKETSS